MSSSRVVKNCTTEGSLLEVKKHRSFLVDERETLRGISESSEFFTPLEPCRPRRKRVGSSSDAFGAMAIFIDEKMLHAAVFADAAAVRARHVMLRRGHLLTTPHTLALHCQCRRCIRHRMRCGHVSSAGRGAGG